MTTASLLWGVLFGSLGAGYCMYARKQRAPVPGICGATLILLPYFLPNTYLLVAIGLVVAAAPFFIKT